MGLPLLIKFFLLFLSFVPQTQPIIYGTTSVFYSRNFFTIKELCSLGTVNSASPATFACPTAVVQENIVRVGIAIAEISKPQNEYHRFVASVNPPGATASSFTIALSVTWPSGFTLSYFLLVIKTQLTYVYIDLVDYEWVADPIIDNSNSGDRKVHQNFTLATDTLFTTLPTTISSYPLTTSFTMLPQGGPNNYDETKYIEYWLAATINSTNGVLKVQLTANDRTKISALRGIAIIYSTSNVATAKTANSWNMSMYQNKWVDPDGYDMRSFGPTFGPNFNTKCLFGYSKITYKGDKTIDWKFAVSSYGNFISVNYPNNNNDFNPDGIFFCFGNGSACGQAQKMFDNISRTCHAPTTCPLPQFSTWTSTAFCPNCTQLICQNCTPSNRSNCLTCGLNSTLVSGACVCNADCWPWTTFISTSASGQWKNTANSLTECRYNCTALITGCAFDKCTSNTFCTICLVGFYLNVTASTTNQNCISCTTILNCLECTGATACTKCITGYFVNAGGCTLCSDVMPNCVTCTDSSTCTLCQTGYQSISPSVCQCSPVLNSMANCALCTVHTACSQCVNTTFFISTVDSLCHSCRQFDLYCITCSANQFCTSCDPGYTVQVSGTTQLCISCTTITNCILCSSPTTCTQCVSGFIPQTGVCTPCGTLMPNCATCLSPTTCTLCQTGYQNISASVCQCSPLLNSMANCIICTVHTACDQCTNNTFFIKTTDSLCHSCRQFDVHCITCSAEQVCNSCDPGYTVVTVGTTSLCKACWDLMPNCTLCSSPTTCDVCNYTYGLTTSFKCQICNTLHMRGCQACTDSTACELCVNQTYLVGGICLQCYVIQKCNTCFVNLLGQLQCLSCIDGNFLTLSTTTGQPICKLCIHFTSFCVTCTNTTCLSCVYPYLPGSDGLCSRCQTGFYYVSGICTHIAGCIAAVYLSNGTSTCLACNTELFYTFDSRTQKCVCKQGYQDFKSLGPLPECRPLCGDGIVIWSSEECDDKNVFPRDGCDQSCKVQAGFTCGFLQPSKCVLVLNIESFVFNYIFRVLGENKGIMSYTIQPGHPGLEMRPWSKIINLKFPASAVNTSFLSYSYESETGQLLITVPYNQELEESTLQAELTLDPAYIQSATPFMSLVHKLNGINAKLIFQQQSELDTHKNINLITMILTAILLLLFYLGSYVHKMIGLETIQVIQAIYFVRMIAPSSSSTLLASMNSVQYATSGYQNSQLFYGDLQSIQNQLNEETTHEFIAINLHKFMLLNTNISLIPIALAIIAYAVNLFRKFRSRNEYLKVREQDLKDQFTRFQRSSQWVYDHFVFPYIMMFNLLSFFQCISLLSKPYGTESQQVKNLETQSFIFHVVLVLCTSAIYCYEISNSLQQFSKYRMSESEKNRVPKSTIERLEHDENNTDRPNYHPAYVLCHLLYYLLMSTLMVVSVLAPTFKNSLELVMGVAVVYFLAICVWNPYHEMVRLHNHFLKFYYGTYVAVLVICYLFVHLPKASGSVYTAFMYVIMAFIGSIITAGFIRIAIELRFRKALQNNNDLMRWDEPEDFMEKKRKSSSQQDELIKHLNRPQLTKRQEMIKRNNYALENQLNQMNKKMEKQLSQQEKLKLAQDGKSYLMNKIQEDIQKKKINSIIEDYSQLAYNNGHQQRKFEVKLNMPEDIIAQEKQMDITHDTPNLAQQMLHSPKKSASGKEKSALDFLKQKLRSEWVYMHEE